MGEFEDLQTKLMADRPDLFRVNSKYAPKLSFVERCAVLLYWKMGYEIPVLAVAFGINRATVRYITNTASRFYKNVRREWVDLGPDAFSRQYNNPELLAKVMKAKSRPEALIPENEMKKLNSIGPNKRATQKAGKHTLTFGEAMGACTLVFDVQWMDSPPYNEAVQEDRNPGWYLILLKDGPGWPAGVYGNAEDSKTSSQALAGFVKETEAELG